MDIRQISRDCLSYVENKRILEIFQNMFERLIINRPENPLDFLYDLLVNHAVYYVPKVFVLGAPSIDIKLVCAAISNKLHLTYLTQSSLEEDSSAAETSKESKDQTETSDSTWAKLLKERVDKPDCARKGWLVEDFPKTRRQAFALRKSGIFPTHIVVIGTPDAAQTTTKRLEETEEEFQKRLKYMEQLNLILDSQSKSYIKKFNIENNNKMEKSIEEVINFIRSKQHPPSNYLPRVLLLGSYGSGRRTVAKKLREKFKVIEVDYKEELRRAALKDSSLKDKFYEILKTSLPVPDELLVKVASERLLKDDCIQNGWVMYNFPDTKRQVELLVKLLEGFQINRAVFLEVSLQTCLDRMESGRWDPNTGQFLHLNQQGSGAVDASSLLQMPEDAAESVKAEHELYSENAPHLKGFFSTQMQEDIVTEVDAEAGVEEVFEDVQATVLRSAKMRWPEDASR